MYKNIVLLFSTILVFFCISCVPNKSQTEKISYWDTARKGANYFNDMPSEKWFEEAQKNNITLVRMTYDKWQTKEMDFLIGNADEYKGLIQEDLDFLIEQLDLADKYGIKIILVPLTVPGARWSQNNNQKIDGRLWQDFKYHEQTAQFWYDLAKTLKDHPAIIGYNIINEPFPEKFYGKQTHWTGDFLTWYSSVKDTAGDLNLFYKTVINKIRTVDKKTTIVLYSGLHATPWAIGYLSKQECDNILYSFHMYEPYDFTTQKINNGQFSYNGEVFINDLKETEYLDKAYLVEFLSRINTWSKKNNIDSNRILVGEFGISREVVGAEHYMKDLIRIFNENSWHWLFYSFQEDSWHSWDYQLGSKKVPFKYWEYTENNTLEENRESLYNLVENTPIWDVLTEELNKTNN